MKECYEGKGRISKERKAEIRMKERGENRGRRKKQLALMSSGCLVSSVFILSQEAYTLSSIYPYTHIYTHTHTHTYTHRHTGL